MNYLRRSRGNSTTLKWHWKVNYFLGSTEGGSSGSPIFNQNGLIVGTLTGGDSDCLDQDLPDMYGKFWFHWDQYENQSGHMNKYLDPINTGERKLDGLNNYDIVAKKNIDVVINSTSTINILTDNGAYIANVPDKNIVEVSLVGDKLIVKGIKLGSAIITLADTKTSVDVKINVREDIVIYSDPNSSDLRVSIFNGDAINQVKIFNMRGQLVYNQKDIDDHEHIINKYLFSKGAYIIQVKTKNGTTKKDKIVW